MKTDATYLLEEFEKAFRNRPSIGEMYAEIKMMKFKIKPIQGEIDSLDMNNNRFIETLWSLGKMDEIFEKNYKNISQKNRESAYKSFTRLYNELQEKMNAVEFALEEKITRNEQFEIEIFKELDSKPN